MAYSIHIITANNLKYLTLINIHKSQLKYT